MIFWTKNRPNIDQKLTKNRLKIDQKSIQKRKMVKNSSWKRVGEGFGRVAEATGEFDTRMV